MWEILYNIIIMPLIYIYEIIFSIMNDIFHNPGIAIIGVSLTVQFMVLPLYKRADEMQKAERDKQKAMEKWVKHIKKTFKGDEKMMMLQTYYYEMEYKPIYALKGSLPLLLQIPFFMAAYSFLSNLSLLQGRGFLLIEDMSKQDQLISLFGISINILPILMTVINIISGYIYTKGFPVKEKIQLYLMAVLFLFILYRSPSGLVLYWTMNNAFSLAKNIVAKYRPAKKERHKVMFEKDNQSEIKKIYYLSVFVLFILCGLNIPASVIVTSPMEFIGFNVGPIDLLIYSACVYFGLFFAWLGLIYYMLSDKHKYYISYVIATVAGVSVADFLLFGKNYGLINPDFIYNQGISGNIVEMLVNIGIVAIIVIVVLYLIKRRLKVLDFLFKIIVATLLVTLVGEVYIIKSDMADAEIISEKNDISDMDTVYKLSKNGQNVVVIMLDRAISQYIPFFLEEKPELMDIYEGFTYYPNTVSYGMGTNSTTPALFGGYEYTPYRLNQREDELMSDKHDEALLVMPRLFSDAGYNVVVTDPPYAGYSEIPDISIYDEIDNVTAYNLNGMYTSQDEQLIMKSNVKQQKRNMIFYSMFRCAPVAVQKTIYDEGEYHSADSYYYVIDLFLGWYSILENLSNITDIADDYTNNLLLIQNSSTHVPTLFDYNYKPLVKGKSVTYDTLVCNGRSCRFETKEHIKMYQVNMASLLVIGEWLEYLKMNDVYDNTRIIIVSDHGWPTEQFDNNYLGEDLSIDCYNPVLLYKDFNSRDFRVSDDFMTNADVSIMATDGLVDAINPFSGNNIAEMCDKNDSVVVSASQDWRITTGNKLNITDDEWLQIKDNVFDPSNWLKYEK